MLIDRAAARLAGGPCDADLRRTRGSARRGRSIGFGDLVKGRKLAGIVPAEAPGRRRRRGRSAARPHARSTAALRHRRAPLHARHHAAGDAVRARRPLRRLRRHARCRSTTPRREPIARRGRRARRRLRRRRRADRTASRAARLPPCAPSGACRPAQPTSDDGLRTSQETHVSGRRPRRRAGSRAGDVGRRAARRGPHVRRELSHSLHRARAARAARGGRRVDRRQADGVDRHAAAVRRALRARRQRSACPRSACASSCRTPGPATAASTRASTPSRRRGWRRPPASRSSWCGRARKSSRSGYFRPAGVIDVKAGVDADGRLTSWEFDNWNSGGAGDPHAVRRSRTSASSSTPSESPLRQGSYRGLAATANHYAREMHMDAIARALGVDAGRVPAAALKDERMRAVLTAAAREVRLAAAVGGRPRARHRVRDREGQLRRDRRGSVAAPRTGSPSSVSSSSFECGAIVNPDGLNNQVEGSVVQGLGGALFEAIEFADGAIVNGTLAQYRVPRFKDMPPHRDRAARSPGSAVGGRRGDADRVRRAPPSDPRCARSARWPRSCPCGLV